MFPKEYGTLVNLIQTKYFFSPTTHTQAVGFANTPHTKQVFTLFLQNKQTNKKKTEKKETWFNILTSLEVLLHLWRAVLLLGPDFNYATNV